MEAMGGLMVSVRESGSRQVVRVRALAGVTVLCSWTRHFSLTVPLFTQVYEYRRIYCWGKPCDGLASYPGASSRNTSSHLMLRKLGYKSLAWWATRPKRRLYLPQIWSLSWGFHTTLKLSRKICTDFVTMSRWRLNFISRPHCSRWGLTSMTIKTRLTWCFYFLPFFQVQFIQNRCVFQRSHACIHDVSIGKCMMPLTGYFCQF